VAEAANPEGREAGEGWAPSTSAEPPKPEAPERPEPGATVIALPAEPVSSPAPASAGAEPASGADQELDEEPDAEPPREPRPGGLELLKLDLVEDDSAFQLRPAGEIDTLATSIARLGQLAPVDVRPRGDRFQLLCGFRRVAALRLLKREQVLSRVHAEMSDEDALRFALAQLVEARSCTRDELAAARARLEAEHRLTPTVRDALDRALAPVEAPLGPETVDEAEEEVDLDELAQDLARRIAAINQDLSLVAELWTAMEPSLRRALLEQLAYPEQMAAYLRSL
jgi:ParB family transcriptional regulator, chromosome partitioning protein